MTRCIDMWTLGKRAGAPVLASIILLGGCASTPDALEYEGHQPPAAAEAPARLESFAQKIEGAALELEMIALPAGDVEIDSVAHKIEPIWMSKTEIPWDLYDLFVYPDLDPRNVEEGEAGDVDAFARPSKPYIAYDRGFGHAGYPALSMSHHAAEEFCKWLSERTGRRYRLPTRAEWIYACRAGQNGADMHSLDLDRVAWHDENSDWKTQPVGRKQPNPFGLHDMLGNTSEWVSDGGDVPIALGGNWQTLPDDLSCDHTLVSSKTWNASDPQVPKSVWWLADAPFVGFRVVCEPPETPTDQPR